MRRHLSCSNGRACLGSKRSSSSSLADRTGATIGVVVARCSKCSSKVCLFFGPVEPRSLQQMWLHKNYNFGTAASYHGLKVVLSKEFAEHENESVKLSCR